MSPVLTVVISIVVLIVGMAIGYLLRKNVGEKTIGSAEQQAKNMILDAQNTVENLKKEKVLEAKEEIHKLRDENGFQSQREEFSKKKRISTASSRILKRENTDSREESSRWKKSTERSMLISRNKLKNSKGSQATLKKKQSTCCFRNLKLISEKKLRK